MARQGSSRMLLERADGYAIVHALGPEREALDRLLREHHYRHTGGGSGYSYAAVSPGGDVVGGAWIGPDASMNAVRKVVRPPHLTWAIRRSWMADESPVPESQMLRTPMRAMANSRGEAMLFVSYAEPDAMDSRTGLPMLGGVYMAAGFFFAGYTGAGSTVVDPDGRARSRRQGAVTLSTGNLSRLRPGARKFPSPPKRRWLAVVTPEVRELDGRRIRTSRVWRKREWLRVWRALNPECRVAARRWIAEREWRRRVESGQRPLDDRGRPVESREGLRRQAAWWEGAQLTRSSAPVWVPEYIQESMVWIGEAEVTGERTAGRIFLPLAVCGAARGAALGIQ